MNTYTPVRPLRPAGPTEVVDNSYEDEMREMQERFNMNEFHEKLKVAEALAQASMLTPPAAKRRLEARKIEMDLAKDQGPIFLDEDDNEYTPPKELLIYIMR